MDERAKCSSPLGAEVFGEKPKGAGGGGSLKEEMQSSDPTCRGFSSATPTSILQHQLSHPGMLRMYLCPLPALEPAFTGSTPSYTLTGTCRQVVAGCVTKSAPIQSDSGSSLRFLNAGVLGWFCRWTLPCAAGGSRCSQSDGCVWDCLMIP